MFKNVVWDLLGRFFNQIVTLVVSIILTRILLPEQFGIIGIALALSGFLVVFYDFGLRASIVQNDDINQVQLSTAFFLNILLGAIIFLLLFSLSKIIGNFYGIAELPSVIKALAFLILINSAASLPVGLLSKALRFREIATLNIIAAVLSGIVAIIMAYSGYGVWSLVMNVVLNALIILFGSLYLTRWLPSAIFSLSSLRPLWKFGFTIFGVNVLESLYSRLDVFLIGKFFSAGALGYYTRAQSMDGFVRQFSSNSIVAVAFPFFSKIKNDLDQLKYHFIRSMHLISFISIFLSGFLFVTATDLFTVLFSKRWVLSGEYFRILAIAGFVYPISALMVNLMNARGNSRRIFTMELTKKGLLLPVFIFGFFWGLKVFISFLVIFYILLLLINIYFVNLEIGLGNVEQIKIIVTYVLVGALPVAFAEIIDSLTSLSAIKNTIVLGGVFCFFYLFGNIIIRTNGLKMAISALPNKKIFLKIKKYA